jgi:hypothetical protein
MKPRPTKAGPGAGNTASGSPAVAPGEAAQAQPAADEGTTRSSDWLEERQHHGGEPPPGVGISSEAEQARNKARVRESKRGSY